MCLDLGDNPVLDFWETLPGWDPGQGHQRPAQEPCPEPPLKASCLSPASPTSVMAPARPCGLTCLGVILEAGAGMQAAQILRDFEFL